MDWPWGLANTLNETGAAVSTANATWWLIPVGLLSAGATLSAVVVALRSQTRQFEHEAELRHSIDVAALEAVANSNQEIRDALASLVGATQTTLGNIWLHMGNASSHRRTLEHYLSHQLAAGGLVFQLNQAIQRTYEAEAALKPLTVGANYSSPNDVAQAHRSLTTVVGRVDSAQGEFEHVQAELQKSTKPQRRR